MLRVNVVKLKGPNHKKEKETKINIKISYEILNHGTEKEKCGNKYPRKKNEIILEIPSKISTTIIISPGGIEPREYHFTLQIKFSLKQKLIRNILYTHTYTIPV